jgi:hypothetical protein
MRGQQQSPRPLRGTGVLKVLQILEQVAFTGSRLCCVRSRPVGLGGAPADPPGDPALLASLLRKYNVPNGGVQPAR